MDTMINDPLRPNLSSRLTQQDLINKGLMAIGMAPMGITKAKTAYELAHDVASKNAEKMLGLPKGNTYIDRAKALGFDDVLHGTSSTDIKAVKTLPEGRKYLNPFYTTADNSKDSAKFASQFANTKSELGNPTIYPLKVRRSDVLDVRKHGVDNLQKAAENSYSNVDVGAKGLPTWGQFNNYATEASKSGIKGVMLDERPDLNSIAVLDPSIIRSRFAAFDPARLAESDLLAGLAPYLGIGGLLALGAYDE